MWTISKAQRSLSSLLALAFMLILPHDAAGSAIARLPMRYRSDRSWQLPQWSEANAIYLTQVMEQETPQPPESLEPADNPGALQLSTFLGGAGDDYGTAVTVDGAGRIYVAGLTNSPGLPTTVGAYDRTYNGNLDVFVAQLNASGTALEYATYIGGSGDDYANGIAVDGNGGIYVVGSTSSSDFPVVSGSFDTTFNGGSDVFALRLGSGGTTLQYSTFLGGSDQDEGETLAVDTTGQAYVAGYTRSANFPTTAGSLDPTHNGGSDAFAVRLGVNGNTLDYATYVGGGGDDNAYEMAVDANERVSIAGATASNNFPTTPGAFDTSYNGGSEDAFVIRLNSTGDQLVFGTFLGGAGLDHGVGVAVDDGGRTYITGTTGSSNFPTTTGSFDSTYNGGTDVFIARLNSTASALDYAGFLGGGNQESSFAIAADTVGRATAVGSTRSGDFPVTSTAFDTSYNGGPNDAFVARVSADGTRLESATFVGGANSDDGYTIALDQRTDVLFSGYTSSSGFPTTLNAFDRSFNGQNDAVVALLTMSTAIPTPTLTPTPTRTPTRTWTPTPTRTWTPTPTRTTSPTSLSMRSLYIPKLVRQATATPSPTPTSIPGDPYEPNNTPAQAWGPLVSGREYRALIYSPSDSEDYYQIVLPLAHTIDVTLDQIPAGNNYHLYLYNVALAFMGYSGNPGNQPEHIQTNVLPSGLYYIRIQRVDGYSTSEQYTLRAVFR